MSWGRQVLHLLRTQLVHVRYAMAVFMILVVLGVAHAFGFGGTSGLFTALMFLMVVFSMALVAFVVQADSPVRSDAFWPSRPLAPSAVLASKVAFALVLIALALAGQCVGLLAFQTSVLERGTDAMWGAAFFGMWLALALVISAVTKTIPNFFVALVVLSVFTIVLAQFNGDSPLEIDGVARMVLMGVLAAAVIASLVRLYARRDGRSARVIGGLLLATSIAMAVPADRTLTARVDKGDKPISGTSVSVALADSATQAANRDLMIVITGVSPDTTVRLALLNALAQVTTANGTSFSVPMFPYQDVASVPAATVATSSSAVVVTEAIGAPRVPLGSSGRGTTTSLRLTPEQQQLVRGGVSRVRLTGSLLVESPVPVTSLRMTPGATAKGDGYRIRVAEVPANYAREAVSLVTERLAGNTPDENRSYASMLGVSAFDVAVVDAHGTRVQSLQQRSSHTTSSWIVLPGQMVGTDSSFYVLERVRPNAPAMSLDSLRRAGASLRISTWRKRAAFPVKVSSR